MEGGQRTKNKDIPQTRVYQNTERIETGKQKMREEIKDEVMDGTASGSL